MNDITKPVCNICGNCFTDADEEMFDNGVHKIRIGAQIRVGGDWRPCFLCRKCRAATCLQMLDEADKKDVFERYSYGQGHSQ